MPCYTHKMAIVSWPQNRLCEVILPCVLCVCRVQTSTLDRRRSSTTVLRIRLYRWTASRLCRALPAESQRQSSAGTATSASFRREIVGSAFCSRARCRLPVRSSRNTHCYRPYWSCRKSQPLTLTHDLDFQSPATYGCDPRIHAKNQVRRLVVQNSEWKQMNGHDQFYYLFNDKQNVRVW